MEAGDLQPVSCRGITCGVEMVQAFAEASGDHSAIHMDAAFARLGRFRQRVVHGMLPVLCLLAPQGREILAISARFVNPAFLGDELDMSLGEPDGDGWQAFQIVQGAGPRQVTSGKVRFGAAIDTAGTAPLNGTLPVVGEVPQALHELAVLSEGQSVSLALGLNPQAMSRVLALAGLDDGLPVARTLLATVCLSTLVGMRMPGKHATFSEFQAKFLPELPGVDPVELKAIISKIHTASRRIQLGVEWTQGGVPFGKGQAVTLVNAPAPLDLSSQQLRETHLDLGLAGKVALVTGASRGIGAATARLLALHGVRVAVHFYQGRADAESVVADIRSADGQAFAVGADLRDTAQVAKMFAAVRAALGEVDILVNNAVGEFLPRSFLATTPADFQAELDVSLLGMHACCQEAVPGMRARHSGKIVNLGTVAVHVPVSGQICYIAAKSAVEGYTRALAAELAADNVQVNLVVPAMTQTSLIAALPYSLVERLAEDNPEGRLLAPADVAQAIVLLSSGWTRGVSGQQWVLNQGMVPFL